MSAPRHNATASSCGGVGALTELADLRHASRVMMARLSSDIETTLRWCREYQEAIEGAMGRPIAGCHALEIGPGQWYSQYLYFARLCRVTAIDLDVLPVGFDPFGYWRMFRENGARRVVKTLGRKALGIDRKYFTEYKRQLGVDRLPTPAVARMDATKTTFADNTFDFVYSSSVFEHVPDPATMLRECARIIRPGGSILTDLHLYTSDSGNHDPRIISGDRKGLPYWPHLRPTHAGVCRTGAYLNKLRLAEWHDLFARTLPGTTWTYRLDDHLRPEAEKLREAGELADYSMDELLTRCAVSVWRKPD